MGRLRRGTMVGSLRYDSRSGVGIQLYGNGRFTPYDPASAARAAGAGPGHRASSPAGSRYARRDQSFAVTALTGIAGPAIGRLQVRDRWVRLPLASGGAFVVAVRGVRSPAELPLRVRYRDGRRALLAAGFN